MACCAFNHVYEKCHESKYNEDVSEHGGTIGRLSMYNYSTVIVVQ